MRFLACREDSRDRDHWILKIKKISDMIIAVKMVCMCTRAHQLNLYLSLLSVV